MQKAQETQVRSLGQEDPLEEEMEIIPVFFPGESHGQRSMVGYSPKGHKELDITKQLSFLTFLKFERVENNKRGKTNGYDRNH